MNRVEAGHQRLLLRVLRIPKLILGAVLVLFIGAVFVLSRMGGEFIPSLEEGDFAVEARILGGSNLTTTIDYTSKAAKILKDQFPEVEKIVTKIGSAEIPTEPMPMDAGDMIIVLKPKKEWVSAENFPELSEKMSKALTAVPGLTTGFQFPVQMRFNELMTGARQDVVCKIFGEDLDSLAAQAEALGALIHTVEGAQDLYIEPISGVPQVVVSMDRKAIARYNLSINDVNRVVNMALAGQQAGLVFEGEKRFDLVVRLEENKRKNIEDIRNILIPTPDGQQIPLMQLADVSMKSSPNQIQREDTKRRVVVGFNVRGRDVQSIVNELQQKVDQQLKLPTGYTISYGGAFENLNQAKSRLGIAVPVSLGLIFLLLYFAFRSFKHSLLIYTAIPLSAIGGVYFLALRGMPFSISAGVGFIALFGVAVLNGIVLVTEYNRLKAQGLQSLSRIVLMGTKLRLRPVLMTAFVASLGFLPMAISTGSGAEVQRPLATVVIGGLLLATFLTLFVLPLLYILVEKMKNPFRKKQHFATLLVLLFTFTVPMLGHSQEHIGIEQAKSIALGQNLSIKNSALQSAYYASLKGSYFNIAPTVIDAEFGQMNSMQNDIKIGISQQIDFPTVYSRKKESLHARWKESLLNEKLNATQLEKQVTVVFYDLLLLQEKEQLLMQIDSMYTQFLDKTTKRLALGETNISERAVAVLQQSQVRNQLKELRSNYDIALLEFNWLLNTEAALRPKGDLLMAWNHISNSDNEFVQHPSLMLMEQKIQVSNADIAIEKAKLMPNLQVGYYGQTMSDLNKSLFSVVQIGVGIPLFTKGQRAVIQSTKDKLNIAKNEYEYSKQQLSVRYAQSYNQFVTQQNIIKDYQNTQIKQAELIRANAENQFANGEINYLEWVMLNNQAIGIHINYYDAVKSYNQYVIELNYLLAK